MIDLLRGREQALVRVEVVERRVVRGTRINRIEQGIRSSTTHSTACLNSTEDAQHVVNRSSVLFVHAPLDLLDLLVGDPVEPAGAEFRDQMQSQNRVPGRDAARLLPIRRA